MAEQKDFNSLDDLFRKTFDDLPDSAGATGWDTPSDRVWEHVQTRIKPPRSGWSGGQILLLASGAIAIALGLYFALAQPQKRAEHQSTTGTEQVTSAPNSEVTPVNEPAIAPAPETASVPQMVEPPRSAKKSAVQQPPAPKPMAVPSDNRQDTEKGWVNHSGEPAERTKSAPLPGSPPIEPNTTVLRNKRGAWAVPLQPLPSALERQKAPPLPDLPDPGKQ